MDSYLDLDRLDFETTDYAPGPVAEQAHSKEVTMLPRSCKIRVPAGSVFAMLAAAFCLTPATARAGCQGDGQPVDINAIFPGQGQTVPPGKTMCRHFGNVVLVPAVAHTVDEKAGAIPPCSGAVLTNPNDEGFKAGLAAVGSTMVTMPDPTGATQAVGVIVIAAGVAWPTATTQTNANCGVSLLILGPTQTPRHWAAFFGYNGEDVKKHPVDDGDGSRTSAFRRNVDYYSVDKTQPLPLKDGRTAYGILFRNWGEGTNYYRHVQIMIDTFE